MDNFLSNSFSLEKNEFVKNRDSLYEYYFKKDFKSHEDFLIMATVCFADVANFHHRMNYYFGSKEAEDQVWFMAKWIIKNKQWSIINGLEQELLANEIGTAIFRELYKNAKTKDENTKQKIIKFYKNKIEPIAPFAIELLIRFILDL